MPFFFFFDDVTKHLKDPNIYNPLLTWTNHGSFRDQTKIAQEMIFVSKDIKILIETICYSKHLIPKSQKNSRYFSEQKVFHIHFHAQKLINFL